MLLAARFRGRTQMPSQGQLSGPRGLRGHPAYFACRLVACRMDVPCGLGTIPPPAPRPLPKDTQPQQGQDQKRGLTLYPCPMSIAPVMPARKRPRSHQQSYHETLTLSGFIPDPCCRRAWCGGPAQERDQWWGGIAFSLKSLAVFENHGTIGLGGMGGLGGIVCAVDGPLVDARAFAGVGLVCVGEGLGWGGC